MDKSIILYYFLIITVIPTSNFVYSQTDENLQSACIFGTISWSTFKAPSPNGNADYKIQGVVTHSKSGIPLISMIELIDSEGKSYRTNSDSTGYFYFSGLDSTLDYQFTVCKIHFKTEVRRITSQDLQRDTTYNFDIPMNFGMSYNPNEISFESLNPIGEKECQ